MGPHHRTGPEGMEKKVREEEVIETEPKGYSDEYRRRGRKSAKKKNSREAKTMGREKMRGREGEKEKIADWAKRHLETM